MVELSQYEGKQQLFKAFIRVVKSISDTTHMFNSVEVVREPLIVAKDKMEVKSLLLNKYPEFFPNAKVYEKETKDNAQFFYVVIFPLYEYEIKLVKEGPWTCAGCGQVHENKYVSRPVIKERLFGSSIMFCRSEDDYCLNEYAKGKFKNVELQDEIRYVTNESPVYIYRCTEKSTGRCYIGKTRNAPFFRWWNHLTKSHSPFGLYLRQTQLSEWTFEVLLELPYNVTDSEVLRIESEYIVQFDSIENGFNSVISASEVLELKDDPAQTKLWSQ